MPIAFEPLPVRDLAQKGNAVIVDRGAAYYLHDRTDALHVFIYAPFEEKVRRLISKGKSSYPIERILAALSGGWKGAVAWNLSSVSSDIVTF